MTNKEAIRILNEQRNKFMDEWVDYGGINEAYNMAIQVLKEQEAIEPDVDSEGTCTCGNCGENVGWYPVGSKEPIRLCKFCSECGREVKWNG